MWPAGTSPVAAHGWTHRALPPGRCPYSIFYSLSEQESQGHPATPQTSPSPALHRHLHTSASPDGAVLSQSGRTGPSSATHHPPGGQSRAV
ncbi:hypothetical protein D623_10013744 [Myotis brandtii]|uniref:Uncharacterized protein n=1 Tax=Myotis brandtii TaxID=109478 RepID=S7Q761_MYOBR|nr:hypothetical protein D623_10013744 [Myotis brandtii]